MKGSVQMCTCRDGPKYNS